MYITYMRRIDGLPNVHPIIVNYSVHVHHASTIHYITRVYMTHLYSAVHSIHEIDLVSQARPNQPQRGSLRDTESNPRWGWLGLACETRNRCIMVV